jgi:hypothetical protein
MSSFGVQQPHTFRQSRPHSRLLEALLQQLYNYKSTTFPFKHTLVRVSA